MAGTTSTTFTLRREGTRGIGPDCRRITVEPMRCPFLHDYPEAVAELLAEGWKLTAHADDNGTTRISIPGGA